MALSQENRAQVRKVRRAALGSRLRQLRKERGLSQQQLADLADMDRSFYAEIETGVHSPRVERLYDLAAALKVHITDLFRQ